MKAREYNNRPINNNNIAAVVNPTNEISNGTEETTIFSNEGSTVILSSTGNTTFIDANGTMLESSTDGSMKLLGTE